MLSITERNVFVQQVLRAIHSFIAFFNDQVYKSAREIQNVNLIWLVSMESVRILVQTDSVDRMLCAGPGIIFYGANV